MTYIENVFVCIAAPLLLSTIFIEKEYRTLIFFTVVGMGSCLLSAYINSFFAGIYKTDYINATTQIAPVVEEVMKLLPLLYYLLIFEPNAEKTKMAIVIITAGFTTFENVFYLIENGAAQLSFILIRGLGTGAMHIVCGAIIGVGLVYVWQFSWLKIAGTFGLLCAAITFHATYNLLIAHGGLAEYIAFSLPLLTMATGLTINKLYRSTVS